MWRRSSCSAHCIGLSCPLPHVPLSAFDKLGIQLRHDGRGLWVRRDDEYVDGQVCLVGKIYCGDRGRRARQRPSGSESGSAWKRVGRSAKNMGSRAGVGGPRLPQIDVADLRTPLFRPLFCD